MTKEMKPLRIGNSFIGSDVDYAVLSAFGREFQAD